MEEVVIVSAARTPVGSSSTASLSKTCPHSDLGKPSPSKPLIARARASRRSDDRRGDPGPSAAPPAAGQGPARQAVDQGRCCRLSSPAFVSLNQLCGSGLKCRTHLGAQADHARRFGPHRRSPAARRSMSAGTARAAEPRAAARSMGDLEDRRHHDQVDGLWDAVPPAITWVTTAENIAARCTRSPAPRPGQTSRSPAQNKAEAAQNVGQVRR